MYPAGASFRQIQMSPARLRVTTREMKGVLRQCVGTCGGARASACVCAHAQVCFFLLLVLCRDDVTCAKGRTSDRFPKCRSLPAWPNSTRYALVRTSNRFRCELPEVKCQCFRLSCGPASRPLQPDSHALPVHVPSDSTGETLPFCSSQRFVHQAFWRGKFNSLCLLLKREGAFGINLSLSHRTSNIPTKDLLCHTFHHKRKQLAL